MAVYVDNAYIPYGRMRMCHMIADSREELDDMAQTIGVPLKWMQYPGTKKEHFDICKAKRALAVKNGAIEITSRELVARLRRSKPT